MNPLDFAAVQLFFAVIFVITGALMYAKSKDMAEAMIVGGVAFVLIGAGICYGSNDKAEAAAGGFLIGAGLVAIVLTILY